MNGLENIVNKLISDAKLEAEEIITKAKEESDNLLKKSLEKTNVEADKIAKKQIEDIKSLEDRIISNAMLRARNIKLQAKRDTIKDIYKEILDELKTLSDEEYIAYIKNNITDMNNTFIVQKDKLDVVKEQLPNLNIDVSSFSKGGFVEKGIGFENNYSYEAKLSLIMDDIEGELAKILFEN